MLLAALKLNEEQQTKIGSSLSELRGSTKIVFAKFCYCWFHFRCPLFRTHSFYCGGGDELTSSHFRTSWIKPSSNLSVILSIRCSSSRTMLVKGIENNGSEWHPGCFDHESSVPLATSGFKK